MPLVRVDLRKGKSAAHKKAVADGVYRALRETFTVPEEDRFIVITEHDDDGFIYSANYLDIARSADLVFVQITVTNSRGVQQKKALFARIVALLAENPGLRREDVFINLLEVVKENWSFGNGIAQYVAAN
jgi:phenylpyruvate tautomerase PptA (4-oxalocrotonate tautomerase family)